MAPASSLCNMDEQDERHRCRHCHTLSLYCDWSAGDVVCTGCGVVHQEHVLDDRPEWRDFSQDNDLAKGNVVSKARCGSIPVNEALWRGGLEPTRLSKHVFGGNSSTSTSLQQNRLRKRLIKTHRQVNHLMERQHAKALKQAKLSRRLLKKRRIDDTTTESATDLTDMDDYDHVNDVGPNVDLQLDQDEEDAVRTQGALNAERWSLDRALLLFGSPEEQPQLLYNREEERQDLLQQLDKFLLQSSKDLYCAYTLLQEASRTLHLPQRVVHEATTMLCRYAARRNGFTVKGVSSRASKTSKQSNHAQQQQDKEESLAKERLREHNKRKQMASLGCALLFLTCRNLGWIRSLPEICAGFSTQVLMIKTKHACKAVAEIKAEFPDYARSMAAHLYHNNNMHDTDRFVEHATRKLNLPPVALASIRLLVSLNNYKGWKNGTTTKLSVYCASLAYFVCMAGSTMQRLAQQAQQRQELKKKKSSGIRNRLAKKRKTTPTTTSPVAPGKKLFKETVAAFQEQQAPTKHEESENKSHETNNKETMELPAASSLQPDATTSSTDSTTRTNNDISTDNNNATTTTLPFDVFSHDAIQQDPSAKMEYEMRRMWDAWTEQMPWCRALTVMEQACGVSRNAIVECYKKDIYPKRTELLQLLQTGVTPATTNESSSLPCIRDTPLASVLLSNITAAAPLMSNK